MEATYIPFDQTGYFSRLICDYLDESEELKPFYNRFPTLDNFKDQLVEKERSFDHSTRNTLYQSLRNQYEGVQVTAATKRNIESLLDRKTYTVVTGHQLNLFTGPLYFLYKIISAVKLTKALRSRYPEYDFVPVYWMATEDHDFDEINYFNFDGKKLRWNRTAGGPVGRFDLQGLQKVFEVVSKTFGNSDLGNTVQMLFKRAYLKHETLAEATRYLVNELFGNYGLVILDGDDEALKRLLVPYAKQDIFEGCSFEHVNKTIAGLTKNFPNYSSQVNPREINYFYIKNGLRERIVANNGSYLVNGTDISFTKEALQTELLEHPERFSPNVITRPLYQEVVLPNLCYIGGGGELAYWLQLKAAFKAYGVTFPMLLLRNSVLLIPEKANQKIQKLGLTLQDLFLGRNQLINKKIRQISNIEIDFSPQKQHLADQFKALYQIAEQTDETFLKAVKAQEVKQKKGLAHLEKRLLKAQKRKLKDHVMRLSDLHAQLFPNHSLQERQVNFSEMYLNLGGQLIPQLMDVLDPLRKDFVVLRY